MLLCMLRLAAYFSLKFKNTSNLSAKFQMQTCLQLSAIAVELNR